MRRWGGKNFRLYLLTNGFSELYICTVNRVFARQFSTQNLSLSKNLSTKQITDNVGDSGNYSRLSTHSQQTYQLFCTMNRQSLSTAVQGLASSKGYDFHTASAEYLPALASTKPTIVMLHPKFRSIEGHKHGKISHSLTLHALQGGAKLSHAERVTLLDTLETMCSTSSPHSPTRATSSPSRISASPPQH